MSKRWKMKQRGEIGNSADDDGPEPKLVPLGPLEPATVDGITAPKQREVIVELMRRYPNGTLHAAEGEFVWRAPAEEFAMMRFFVNADGMIDTRPELALRKI